MIEKVLAEKLKKIKVVLTDSDGVLTDGGVFYNEKGEISKKFNIKDGMGSRMLREKGIKVGLVSSDPSPMPGIRAERLKFNYIYTNLWDKYKALEEIAEKENVSYEEVAFIGDDINDLSILEKVGLKCAPADACKEVLAIVDFVTEKRGGEGVFREIADLILEFHK